MATDQLQKMGDDIKRSQIKTLSLKKRRSEIDQQITQQEEKTLALNLALIDRLQAAPVLNVASAPSKKSAARKGSLAKAAGVAVKTAAKKVGAVKETAPAKRAKPAVGRKQSRPDVSAEVLDILKGGRAWASGEIKKELERRNVKVINVSSTLYHLMKKNKVKRLKAGKNKGSYTKI